MVVVGGNRNLAHYVDTRLLKRTLLLYLIIYLHLDATCPFISRAISLGPLAGIDFIATTLGGYRSFQERLIL